MARTETIKINFDIQNASINELDKELASINDELRDMSQNDPGFDQKAKEAAKLTNQLNKANAAAEGFTDDKKFLAADGAIKAMSGAVTGVVGALGLLGIESEVFGEMEKKAASAIAVGLGIKDLSEGFRDMKKSGMLATAQVKIFGKATKSALIATGIGAFIIALGTVYTYWDDIVDLVQGTTAAQKEYNKQLEISLELHEDDMSVLESEKRLLEAQGLSTLDVNRKLLAKLKLQMKITDELIKQKEIELFDAKEAGKQVTFTEKLGAAWAFITKGVGAAATELITAQNPATDEAIEKEKELNALKSSRNNLETESILLGETVGTQAEFEAKGQVQLASAITSVGVAKSSTGEITATTLDETTAKQIQANQLEKLAIKNAEELEEREYAKGEAMYATGEAMGALGTIIGQQTKAGKSLASAQALINTYLGVTEVLKQKSTLPSPFDVIVKVANVATILASGLAAVKNINSVPVSETGTASGGGGGINQTAAQPPAIDLGPVAAAASAPESQGVQSTVRAYVLTGDVNSSQEANARLNNRRSLG